jgi:hypothetical protein
VDDRLRAAVDANVAWCGLVCRAHGIRAVTRPGVWSTTTRAPALYPDAISLRSDATDVLAGTEPGPGRSVKDSFATLDLRDDGFDVLFDARWIWRPPAATLAATEWVVVDLETWRAAASAPDSIRRGAVASEDVRVLANVRGGEVAAGAIANRSGDAVGVSNVFTLTVDPEDLWSTLPAAVAAHLGPLPLVGYETGDDLSSAQAAGFEDIGPLRVWLAP